MNNLLALIITPFLWNMSNFIMRKRYDAACIKARKSLPELLPQVAETLKRQRNEGGLSHEFSEMKLLELAEFLWKHQPKTILELGGGGTTSVFATYAATSPDIRVISVDEDPNYLNTTRERIDSKLRDRIDFVHCPRKETTDTNGKLTCYYNDNWKKSTDNDSIDLVYVDGPTTINKSGKKMPCSDVSRLCDENWKIGHVLFDVRIPSVRYCAQAKGLATHRLHLHRNALDPKADPWVAVDVAKHHSWFEPSPITST